MAMGKDAIPIVRSYLVEVINHFWLIPAYPALLILLWVWPIRVEGHAETGSPQGGEVRLK